MMLNKGRYDGGRILSRLSVELMTIDQLTGQQKAENAIFFGGRSGWGLGVQVITRRTTLGSVPGRVRLDRRHSGRSCCWSPPRTVHQSQPVGADPAGQLQRHGHLCLHRPGRGADRDPADPAGHDLAHATRRVPGLRTSAYQAIDD
jgi:hypothetical protein